MARIRSIHPGLFTDEAFVGLSMAARMLLIGILTEADDHGVFEWKPVSLKMRVFPADNLDVPALLEELCALRQVSKFEVDGKQYGICRNFCRYQKPKKPSYKHPFPAEWYDYVGFKLDESPTSSPPVPHQFPTSGEISVQREEGIGEGEEKKKDSLPVADATATGGRGIDLAAEGSPTMAKAISLAMAPKMFEEFWAAYPKREGANPRQPAFKKFRTVLISGVSAEQIIASARAYSDELRKTNKLGTSYVAQAVTWLNQQRWGDYTPTPSDAEKEANVTEFMRARGYAWLDGKWSKMEEENGSGSQQISANHGGCRREETESVHDPM